MTGNRARPVAFWVVTVFLSASILLMLVGQTTGVFNYDLAASWGLQEKPEEMTEFGVQVNRAFGAADTVVYIPLMALTLIGLALRRRWALATLAAFFGASLYWTTTVTFIFLFAPGVPGYTHVPGPEIWLFIGVYFVAGVLGTLYLAVRGDGLILCRAGMTMDITYRAIGTVRSPHHTTEGMPIQPSRATGVVGTIEMNEEYVGGLADLDGFSHVIVVAHLHRAAPYTLRVVPYLDTELRGVFATRAPARPNPIGISVLRLLGIEGPTVRVEGLDLLDGTPVLDLKPYVPEFEPETEIRCGWLDRVEDRAAPADSRFEA